MPRAQQQCQRLGRAPGRRRQLAAGVVAHARHVVGLPVAPDVRGGHLAGRERAGLVGADDGRRAERLDGAQALDQRVRGGHPLHPDGQRDRHHRRQALGHEGDHDAEGIEERVDERRAGGQPQAEQRHAERDRDERDAPGGDGDLALERARRVVHLAGEPVDPPELGVGAGPEDDGAAGPRGHGRAREDEVARLDPRHLLEHRLGLAAHRLGLPGQRRVGGGQLGDRDQAAVGRDRVALGEQDHVARHELLGSELGGGPVTQRARVRRQHPLQSLGGALGAVLLREADHRVEQHHGEDGDRDLEVGRVALDQRGGQRDRARDLEQDREEVLELGEECRPRRAAAQLGQAVGPVALEPGARLGAGQAGRPALERGERLGLCDALDGDFWHGRTFPHGRPGFGPDAGRRPACHGRISATERMRHEPASDEQR